MLACRPLYFVRRGFEATETSKGFRISRTPTNFGRCFFTLSSSPDGHPQPFSLLPSVYSLRSQKATLFRESLKIGTFWRRKYGRNMSAFPLNPLLDCCACLCSGRPSLRHAESSSTREPPTTCAIISFFHEQLPAPQAPWR